MVTLTGFPSVPSNYDLREIYTCQARERHNNQRVPADGTLHGPDGVMVPGWYICKSCGEHLVDEYQQALYETWFYRPFDERTK